MVFTVPVGGKRAGSSARPDRSGRCAGSGWCCQKPALGVQADQGPQGFGQAQPLAGCACGHGQHGKRVAQGVGGSGQLVERVGVEPDEGLAAALP